MTYAEIANAYFILLRCMDARLRGHNPIFS